MLSAKIVILLKIGKSSTQDCKKSGRVPQNESMSKSIFKAFLLHQSKYF